MLRIVNSILYFLFYILYLGPQGRMNRADKERAEEKETDKKAHHPAVLSVPYLLHLTSYLIISFT